MSHANNDAQSNIVNIGNPLKTHQSSRTRRLLSKKTGCLMLLGCSALQSASANPVDDNLAIGVPQAVVKETQVVRIAPSSRDASTTVSTVPTVVTGVDDTADMTDDVTEEAALPEGHLPTATRFDRMEQVIAEKSGQYAIPALAIEQRTRVQPTNPFSTTDVHSQSLITQDMQFDNWLNASPYRVNEVANYQQYLAQQVGIQNVPPMEQLLTSARSWAECGYDKYQLPPRELWGNMVLTLKLYADLKAQGVLPPSTEIRSVYRPPALNACAGGASRSKHLTNGAIDVWVPEQHGVPWHIEALQDNLCEFWQYQGKKYDLGLGIYGTGSIHLDTQGYRKWGEEKTHAASPCRD